jgi:hypothetical protein
VLVQYVDRLLATILGVAALAGLWIKRQQIRSTAELDVVALVFLILLPIGLFWWAGADSKRRWSATLAMIVSGYVGIGIALTLLR